MIGSPKIYSKTWIFLLNSVNFIPLFDVGSRNSPSPRTKGGFVGHILASKTRRGAGCWRYYFRKLKSHEKTWRRTGDQGSRVGPKRINFPLNFDAPDRGRGGGGPGVFGSATGERRSFHISLYSYCRHQLALDCL